MALRLKSSEDKILYGNDEFTIEGHTYRLYLDDSNERWHLQKAICLENYVWFREETGTRNWVLYNPKQYRVSRNNDHKRILTFNEAEYDGSRLEVPINASSCCGLFSWCKLPDNLEFTSMFDTRNVLDMSLMFAGSSIPKYFTFGTHFHTENVRDMHYMFYKTVFWNTMQFSFNTTNVTNFSHMFTGTSLPKNCNINLDLSNAKDVSYMFHETKFAGKPEFGRKFIINDSTMNTDSLFLNARLNGDIIGREIMNI